MQVKIMTKTLAVCAMLTCMAAAAQAEERPVSRLDEIVVTADRGDAAKREVTSNISIIDNATIQNSAANNLGELMAEQGFQVRKYPGSLVNIGIRGYHSDSHGNDLSSQVLILLDGRRIGTGNLAAISLANVEKVEIIRGPASVQYGAAASGGVVNVITKKGADNPENSFTARLEAGAGSYNSYKAKADMAANVENFDMSLGYSYYKSDDYSDGNGDRYKFTREKGINAFNLDAGYSFFNTHRVGVNLNYFDASGSYSPGANRPTTTRYNDTDKTNMAGTLTYTGATQNRAFDWTLRYGLGEDERVYVETMNATGIKNNRSTYTVNSQNALAQLGYNHSFFSVTAGTEYVDYDLEDRTLTYASGARVTTKSEYRNWAGFVMGKLRLFDEMLIISVGGRFDDFSIKGKSQNLSTDKDHFSPSVGVAFLPVSWLKLRANYAQAFYMPSPGYIFGSRYYVPALNLKPETNDTYEAGFDISYSHFDLGVTYFYSKAEDALVSQRIVGGPNNGKYVYTNYADAKRQGLEVELSGDIGRALGQDFELRPYFNLNYMLQYEGRQSSGASYAKLTKVPEYTIGYGVRFSYAKIGFTTALNCYYVGTEKASATKDIGGYNVVNWTLGKRLFELDGYGELSLKAEVNNLFNRQYEHVDDYPMPGRNFYLGLAYTY